jgi:hypothetical protein
MIENMNRRSAIGMSMVAATAAGLTLVGAAPGRAKAAAVHGWQGRCPDPVIPVVPGMSGDPRANQCWYELDEVGLYNPSPQFVAAIQAVTAAVGNPDVEVGIAEAWLNDRQAGTYPGGFISLLQPVQQSLQVLSDTEQQVFETYYGCDPRGLVAAMGYFGQGILYDPRRPVGAKVHMMGGDPPPGYIAWHAFNRAFAFLGISQRYWDRFDPLVGFGWAVQSTAKPVVDAHNPPLPASVMRTLAQQWLRLSPDQVDEAFMSFPYPVGIS